MATKKIKGNELKQLVESLVIAALMEQMPTWMRKAMADPKAGAALDAALQKQYAKRNNLPADEKEREALEYEVMRLVSAERPTEKERQRMNDIFVEARRQIKTSKPSIGRKEKGGRAGLRDARKDLMPALLKRLGGLIGVTNDFFDEVGPVLGNASRGLTLSSDGHGYVMVMPVARGKGMVMLLPYDIDGEYLKASIVASVRDPEKLLDAAEDLLRNNL